MKYEHLLGRPWLGIGRNDCFALFRDFYADNFGIGIANYARPHDWKSDELDLIGLCHDREGFDRVTDWKARDLRPGDGLAMCIGERNPNHLSVYVGDNTLVHQLYGKMSRTDPLRDFWLNATAYVLRHPDVPDLRETYDNVNIMDLIRARNTPQT